MTEVERIIDQYDRVIGGSAWHGDPVWKILDGVSAARAAAREVEAAHTIWELVMHMIYWETMAAQRMSNLPSDYSKSLNFPAMPAPTQANWRKTLKEFRASNRNFRKAISRLDSAQLDKKMPRDRRKSFYVEAQGLIQHHVYHAGQIAILKKAFDARRKKT